MTSQARKDAWLAAMKTTGSPTTSSPLHMWEIQRGRRAYFAFYFIRIRVFQVEMAMFDGEGSLGPSMPQGMARLMAKVIPPKEWAEAIALSITRNHAQRKPNHED